MEDTYTPPISQALIYLYPGRLDDLKRQLILFDRVVTVKSVPPLLAFPRDLPVQLRVEMEYLEEQGLLIHFDRHPDRMRDAYQEMVARELTSGHKNAAPGTPENGVDFAFFSDYWLRSTLRCFRDEPRANIDSIPMLERPMGPSMLGGVDASVRSLTDLMRLSLSAFPMPDDDTPWETIIEFRQELAHRKWGLRRFLGELSRKTLTEAEIRDELEWNVAEYSRALEQIRAKASYSSFETFILAPLEIIENVVKFNWSAIAKGMISVKKRKAELLAAELAAPGKECAYVFEARERFGIKGV